MNVIFKYYLVDGQGRSYYVDESGIVRVSSIPVAQKYTPDGWQSKTVQWGRNVRWPGVIRSFTNSFRFVKDGALILRNLYYGAKGIQTECNLVILMLNPKDGVYYEWYTGGLDFSQKDDQPDYFQTNVMERGLPELINANAGTTYEIPVDVPEALDVTMDGIELYSNVVINNYEDVLLDNDGNETPNVHYDSYTNIGCVVNNSETKYPSLLFTGSATLYSSSNDLNPPPDDWVLEADRDTTVTIKATIKFKLASNEYRVIGYFKNGAGESRSIIFDQHPFADGTPKDITSTFNTTFTMHEGERLWFVVYMDTSGDGESISFNQEGNTIELTYNYRGDATVVKWLPPFYVFNQLIQKITNGRYQADSSLLKGEALDYVVSCGDAIRGFKKGDPVGYAGPVIKTSLNDFVSSYNTRFNNGLGIQSSKAILEKESFYFNDEVIASLGEVARLRSRPSTDRLFNRVVIGWPNQNYEDVNGRYEFNTTQEYSTPITRIQKTKELGSVYRADCFGIEYTRLNFENKKSTDSSSDNDVFVLNVKKQGDGYIINRPDFDSITGVVSSDTVFNVLLSPKRCLLEHGYSLHCGLDKQDTEYLVYQTTDKNKELSTTLAGTTIKESANILIGSLAPALSYPEELEFDCEVPINIKQIIEANPYGLIEIFWKGIPLYGHILEAGQQPSFNPAQTYKLLLSKKTDITKLIM